MISCRRVVLPYHAGALGRRGPRAASPALAPAFSFCTSSAVSLYALGLLRRAAADPWRRGRRTMVAGMLGPCLSLVIARTAKRRDEIPGARCRRVRPFCVCFPVRPALLHHSRHRSCRERQPSIGSCETTAGGQCAGGRGDILDLARRFGPAVIIGSFILCRGDVAARALFRPRWPSLAHRSFANHLYLVAHAYDRARPDRRDACSKSLLGPRAASKDYLPISAAMLAYTPPWQISDQCSGNCSFASGHAAVTFWLTAYAFLLPPRWRTMPGNRARGSRLGFAMGAVRSAQGAHFITDVATRRIVLCCS